MQSNTGKMICDTCAFSWVRQAQHADKSVCPKCQTPQKHLGAAGKAHGLPWDSNPHNSGKRQPGEVSTFKRSAGDAMESVSGSGCPKNGGGPHTWKYGKCNMCQKPEGKLAGNSPAGGNYGNPGAAGGCPKGGKHMYKFSKCSKCGASEF